MKFAVAATIIPLIGLIMTVTIARTQGCGRAGPFGNMRISPRATHRAGDNITISVYFPCTSDETKILPKFLHYTIEASAGAAAGSRPIFLANREVEDGSTLGEDEFTVQIPRTGSFTLSSIYSVVLTGTYAITTQFDSEGSTEDARVMSEYILIRSSV